MDVQTQQTTLCDTIGHTPMLRLCRMVKNPLATVLVKVEFMNPSGSIKDRIVKYIFEEYENEGKLKPGSVIVENSSGNTAAGIAMLSAAKGYKAALVVPAKCSAEKVNAIKAFGARVVVAQAGAKPGSPDHYEAVSRRLAATIPGAVLIDQYNNSLNPKAHYSTTGPEIYAQTNGTVDMFVCGASTGGTLSGVAQYLKEQKGSDIKVALVDPAGSCLKAAWETGEWTKSAGSTEIEGIGKDYFVKNMDFSMVDEALSVTDCDAIRTAQRMAEEEGILCGMSSGANVWAALELAERVTEPTTLVTVLPDGGSKYLSKIFNPEWLAAKNVGACCKEAACSEADILKELCPEVAVANGA